MLEDDEPISSVPETSVVQDHFVRARLRSPRGGYPGSRRRLAFRIIFALLFALAVGIAALGGLLSAPKVYRSTAGLLIDDPRGIDRSGDALLIDKLSQLRLKYVGLVRTDQIAAPVARATSLPDDAVLNSLFARVDQNSLLMDVGADYSTSGGAQRIAQAGASAMIDYVKNEQAAFNIPPNLQFYFQNVLPARPGVRIKPSTSNALEGGAAAAVLAFGMWFGAAALLSAARHGA